jgi:hypothetical protein
LEFDSREVAMRRTLLFSVIAALAVLAPGAPAAHAKVMPVAATVCGSSGCEQRHGNPLSFDLMIPVAGWAEFVRSPARAKGKVGPWYSVDLRFGPPAVRSEARNFRGRFPVAYLPRSGYLRTHADRPHGSWLVLSPSEDSAYLGLTHGLEPFPSSRLSQPTASPSSASTGGGGFPWVVLTGGIALAAAACLLALRSRQAGAGISWAANHSEEGEHAHGEEHEGSEGLGGR